MAQGYDFISDVHGEGIKLERLLSRLGYIKRDGVYEHPDRQAVFVGDLINKGDTNRLALEIARRMQESGKAHVVMGNHEFDHIRFFMKDQATGDYLLRHTSKNSAFAKTFFEEILFGSEEHRSAIDWFKKIPLYLSLCGGDLIVAHAAYTNNSADSLCPFTDNNNVLKEDAFAQYGVRRDFYFAARPLLFGDSVSIPIEIARHIPDMHIPPDTNEMRRKIYWWRSERESILDLLGVPGDLTAEHKKEVECLYHQKLNQGNVFYRPDQPVVCGHYALRGEPHLTSSKILCIDFAGALTAYRYSEQDRDNFFEGSLVSIPLGME